MRNAIHSVVATIVTGVTLACNDAAVDQVTAPPLAATPAAPVLNNYPGTWEYTEAGIPSAIGLQITTTPRWSSDYKFFIVAARVSFQWANFVSATLNTSVVDKSNRVINSGSAGILYSRFLLPVYQGDTTLTVTISTNGNVCGLMGSHDYSGSSKQMAVNLSFAQMSIWHQDVGPVSGPDILQPACPPPAPPPPPPGCDELVWRLASSARPSVTYSDSCAPAPPNGGSSADDPIEVCYTIWRELWYYDFYSKQSYFIARFPIGVMCYVVGNMT